MPDEASRVGALAHELSPQPIFSPNDQPSAGSSRSSRRRLEYSKAGRQRRASNSATALDRRAPRYGYDWTNYDAPAVVNLQMVEAASGVYYTMPVKLGGTTYNLQPDTGSSDLWVAGNACKLAACTNVQLYTPVDSDTAHDAEMPFTIDYVVGSVSGEIYWEEMEVGGRIVPYQAMAAASQVEDEDLFGGKFSGVIGLSLPGNSIIDSQLNSPWGLGPLTNLEITPPPPPDGVDLSTGPDSWYRRRRRSFRSLPPDASSRAEQLASRALGFTPYITMSLSRPSAPTVPSQIGFDTHLSNLCPGNCVDRLAFTNVIESPTGVPLFWRVPIQGIAVTDATGKNTTLSIGKSAMDGQAWPVGVLDSGAMGIYSGNRNLLNSIYGSAGYGPGKDGNYYIPCTLAINITIIMSIGSFPIHPLDVSNPISGDSTTCLGALQYVSPSVLTGKGDLILGAAFMRNVYTVLSGPAYTRSGAWNTPQLSLLALTDGKKAADEFYRVRILNQNIPTPSSQTPASATSDSARASSGSKTNVAMIAGVAVASVLALVVAVFLARFFFVRRKIRGLAGKPLANGKKSSSSSADGSANNGSNIALAEDSVNGQSHAAYNRAPDSPGAYYGLGDRGSAMTTSGSIGSSTIAGSSLYDTDDEDKGLTATGTGWKTRPPGPPRRQVSSLMGGGYEDVDDLEDGKGGLTGSYAPWGKVDDDDDEIAEGRTYDMARISSYDAATADVPILASSGNNGGVRDRWIQASPSKTLSSARADGSRPSRATSNTQAEADQLVVDRLMKEKRNRRDSRRSGGDRTESPASADRASQASSSNWTLSSTSTAPGSGSHHSYPPATAAGARTLASSSVSSGGSAPLASPASQAAARDRPSLVTYASTRTPLTIVESPTASPIDADRSFQTMIPEPRRTSPPPSPAPLPPSPGGRRKAFSPFKRFRGGTQPLP